MDAKERESGTPEETDPLRTYAMQNAARAAVEPSSNRRSWIIPFLVAVLITAGLLAAAYYLWGK
jgi:hypothetical protein